MEWIFDGFAVPFIDEFDCEDFMRRARIGFANGRIGLDTAFATEQGGGAWKRVRSYRGYRQSDNCTAALKATLRSSLWTRLLLKNPVGVLVDFGPGTGEKTADMASNLLQFNSQLDVRLIDINEELLFESSRNLSALSLRRGFNIRAAALRAEFGLVENILSTRMEGRLSCTSPAAFLLLGQTLGNLLPDEALGLFSRNMRVGDIAIIGVDLAVTAQGDEQNPADVLNSYQNSASTAIWRRGVDTITTGGDIKADLKFQEGSNSFSVIASHTFNGKRTEVFRSTRYAEEDLVWMFAGVNCKHLFSVVDQRNPFYKYLIFRMVK